MKDVWTKAKNLLKYSAIFLTSHFLFLSYAPEDLSQVYEMEQKMQDNKRKYFYEKCEMSNKISILTDNYEKIYDENMHLRAAYKRLHRTRRRAYAYSTYLVDRINLARPGINLAIDIRLLDALKDYKGPKFTLTSARRLHSHGSQHQSGEAVDIRWNDQAVRFIEYLSSEEGRMWLDTHSLSYIIENVDGYGDHTKYMFNPYATGPHIHLHINRYVKNNTANI